MSKRHQERVKNIYVWSMFFKDFDRCGDLYVLCSESKPCFPLETYMSASVTTTRGSSSTYIKLQVYVLELCKRKG